MRDDLARAQPFGGLMRNVALAVAALAAFALLGAALSEAHKPKPPAMYRSATPAEKRAMNKAIPNHGPYELPKNGRFGWYVFKADTHFGIVCGRRQSAATGDPVQRKHGNHWKFGPTDSGDLQNATYECGTVAAR